MSLLQLEIGAILLASFVAGFAAIFLLPTQKPAKQVTISEPSGPPSLGSLN